MGNIRLYGSTSGYTELAPPAVAPDGVLSLPSGTGTLATQDYAAGAGSLVHINTSTFTAQNSIILNDIFTATYDNYLLIHTITTTTGAGNLLMRMRASGTNNTSANYGFTLNNVVYSNGAESNYASGTGATSFTLVQSDSGEPSYVAVTFINPFQSYRTAINIQAAKDDRVQFGGGMMTVTNAYDGVEIYHSTANMTGTVRVYGYKNS